MYVVCIDVTIIALVDQFHILPISCYYFTILGATVFQVLCTLLATEIIIYYIRKYIKKCVSKDVIADKDITSVLEQGNYQKFTNALDFSKASNKKHPSLYTRLELGNSWDDVVVRVIATCHLQLQQHNNNYNS